MANVFQRLAEFYNTSHGEDGRFDEGPDGPGRKRDPGTEDLGVPGYSDKSFDKKTGRYAGGSYDGALKAAVSKSGLGVEAVKTAPPSKKSIAELEADLKALREKHAKDFKGNVGVGKGIGQFPRWEDYPGAPDGTDGDKWEKFIASEGGKKFLADVEKFENPDQEKKKADEAKRAAEASKRKRRK